jgi:hypothetical protein
MDVAAAASAADLAVTSSSGLPISLGTDKSLQATSVPASWSRCEAGGGGLMSVGRSSSLPLCAMPALASGHDLHGKRALLTGATGGLGRAIAKALAARGASLVFKRGHLPGPSGRSLPKTWDAGG